MRILIADDHILVREGLHTLLDALPDIEIIGEAANGQEAVEQAEELAPDIVLMDITMPVMSGLDATRRIKRKHPEIKVLVLTMHDSDEYFFSMLDAGASGYFIKGGSSGELASALRSVMKGDVFLYPSMAKTLVKDYLSRLKVDKSKDDSDGLTKREREILQLIAEGNSNQEIAESLVLSAATVQTHRANIMAKLGLHSRTELIKYALKRGFITLDT